MTWLLAILLLTSPAFAQMKLPQTIPHAPATNAPTNAPTQLPTVSAFGADTTGASDATSALQDCLNAAASSTCVVDPGATLRLAGNVTIPAHTTLSCANSFPSSDDMPSGFAALPALRLAARKTISAAGQAAAIRGCLIYPDGMTLPQSSSAAWSGTAVSSAGHADFAVQDSVIFGFDGCIDAYGSNRVNLSHLLIDCTGATHGAVRTGHNSDSGYIKDLKIQPLATGNGDCTTSVRAGTGLKLENDAFEFIDKTVVQNFLTHQVWLYNSNASIGALWTDNLGHYIPGCNGRADVGLEIDMPGYITISQLNLNSHFQGMRIAGAASPWRTVYIGDLFLNQIEQDCVQIGAARSSSGTVTVAHVAGWSGTATCGRYAFSYLDTLASSMLRIYSGELTSVNGRASPYVNVAAGISADVQLQVSHLVTDLPAGQPLIGGTALTCVEVASAAALPLSDHSGCWRVTGTTNITSLSGVWGGRELTLVFAARLTLINGKNIALAGGVNFTTSAGSLIRLFCYAPTTTVVCKEVARAS
jgi:hypothetical protein